MQLESAEGLKRIPFQGREITLRSPAATTLELPRSAAGTAFASKVLAWAPIDKEALTVEVRARMVATSADDTVVPVCRFFLEVGHGNRVWREPESAQRPTDLEVQGFSLPGRGTIFNVSVREFRIGFQNAGDTDGGNVESIKVAVSINPLGTGAGEVRSVPTASDFGFQDEIRAVPIAAREFRCSQQNSTNVGGGGPDVDWYTINGFTFSGNQSQYDNAWWPIPHEAAYYSMSIADGNYIHWR